MSAPRSARPIIRRLLAKHGITSYRLFLLQAEGKALLGDVEAISGFVIARNQKVYGFWLDIDDDDSLELALNPFYEVTDPDEQFQCDPEYLAAKAAIKRA